MRLYSALKVTVLTLLLTACGSGAAATSIDTPTLPPATTLPQPTATLVPVSLSTLKPSPIPTTQPPAYQFEWALSTKDAPLFEAGPGAVDAQGNIYLLTGAEQVVVLDSAGQVVRVFGEPGSKPGQFTYHDDISTPLYPNDLVAGADVAVAGDGTIYVADAGNFRVQAFDGTGKFLLEWGKRGQADGEFEVPWAIATDRAGNVFVGDFTGTIQKFDRSGKFLARFGQGRGAGKGQFVGAVDDIETDAQGNVYATDRKSGRIQKFDAAGNFVTQWEQCGGSILDIRGLAVDEAGTVYVATRSGHRVCVFDSNGSLITTFGQEGLRDGDLLFGDSSLDLAVSADGSLVVADSAGERLQKFKRN
jgi:tripartite motif-containing protein 71